MNTPVVRSGGVGFRGRTVSKSETTSEPGVGPNKGNKKGGEILTGEEEVSTDFDCT